MLLYIGFGLEENGTQSSRELSVYVPYANSGDKQAEPPQLRAHSLRFPLTYL